MTSRLAFRLLAASTVSFGVSATLSDQAQTSQAASAHSPTQKSSQQPEEGSANIEEVLVTAQKRVERLQDVPVPVMAVNADALVERNKLRLQDYYCGITTGRGHSTLTSACAGFSSMWGRFLRKFGSSAGGITGSRRPAARTPDRVILLPSHAGRTWR